MADQTERIRHRDVRIGTHGLHGPRCPVREHHGEPDRRAISARGLDDGNRVPDLESHRFEPGDPAMDRGYDRRISIDPLKAYINERGHGASAMQASRQRMSRFQRGITGVSVGQPWRDRSATARLVPLSHRRAVRAVRAPAAEAVAVSGPPRALRHGEPGARRPGPSLTMGSTTPARRARSHAGAAWGGGRGAPAAHRCSPGGPFALPTSP